MSDSIEERLSDFNIMSSGGYSISDVIIFKYCLGGLTDRALLLKEVATSASEEELFRLANEVSLYSGCSHHRYVRVWFILDAVLFEYSMPD